MRLLVATPMYPPRLGGPATFTALLEKHLPRYGFTVSVLSLDHFAHLPFGVRHIAFTFYLYKMARHTEALLALDPLGVGLPAYFVARLRKRKLFLRIVGDRAWETLQVEVEQKTVDINADIQNFQYGRFGWRIELRRFLQKLPAKYATKVIVPSKFLQKLIGTWGISESKIAVIGNAFTPIKMNQLHEEARDRLGLSGTIILTAGRLVSWKGMRELARVVERMKEEARVPLRLLVAGDGPLAAELRNFSSVELLGMLSKENLYVYARAADVFVLNSSYEGLSHVLLEVMSIGTPIIATDIGGNAELLTDKKTALLIPYGDDTALEAAITEVLTNSAAAKERAQAAMVEVQKFTVERLMTTLTLVLGGRI